VKLGDRKRYPYTRRLFLKKVGVGEEYIDDLIVEAGKVVVLRNIVVVDETTALTYSRIGKMSGDDYIVWNGKDSPAAKSVLAHPYECWLREGEKFRAALLGGLANDLCYAFLDGYWFFGEESGPTK